MASRLISSREASGSWSWHVSGVRVCGVGMAGTRESVCPALRVVCDLLTVSSVGMCARVDVRGDRERRVCESSPFPCVQCVSVADMAIPYKRVRCRESESGCL